jgi:hypothetical protein
MNSLINIKLLSVLSTLIFVFSALETVAVEVSDDVLKDKFPTGVIISGLDAIGYSGEEELHYDVSWTGGIKIGELHLQIKKLPEVDSGYAIDAVITTKNGAVNLFYPISDRHLTKVKGEKKLPFYYEIWQKEGYSYEAHKVSIFDQQGYTVSTQKNGKTSHVYQLSGEVNNEFSSFFNSRLMAFEIAKPFLVPTFADKKRVEVAVHPVAEEILRKTILGTVSTFSIMPVMEFKGLYDKRGDTVIWYTNDECRVPVKINSKIAIGSLTARLSGYKNPACNLYPETPLK